MISTKSEKKERLEAFSRLKKVSALHPFYRAPTKKFANYKVVLRQPGGYRLPQRCRGDSIHDSQTNRDKQKLRLHTPDGVQTQEKTIHNSSPVTAGASKCSQRI